MERGKQKFKSTPNHTTLPNTKQKILPLYDLGVDEFPHPWFAAISMQPLTCGIWFVNPQLVSIRVLVFGEPPVDKMLSSICRGR